MSTVLKIPTSPQSQQFSITLGTVTYNVTLKWNYIANAWVLDFADIDNNPILQGVPLITGADLLEQYAYLNFAGQLIAQTDNNPDLPPSYATLGSDANLYFVTNP